MSNDVNEVSPPKPTAPVAASAPKPKRPPRARALWIELGIVLGMLVAAYVLFGMGFHRPGLVELTSGPAPVTPWTIDVAAWLALGACMLSIGIFFHSIFTLIRVLVFPNPVPKATTVATVEAMAMAVLGFLAAITTLSNFARGRQLRRRRKVLLPKVGPEGRAWTQRESMSAAAVSQAPDARQALARQWRENGKTEHASVAAFARLTLDLMALGAPPALIAASQRDGLDELRHAELCFGLARAIDDGDDGPMAFPEVNGARTLPAHRRLALAQLAVDSLIDGALLEGFSARLLGHLIPGCTDDAARAVVSELARDEGRHAQHGWEVLDWCLVEGGAPVAHALRGALRAIPEHGRSTLPALARDGAWEPFGIAGTASEVQAYARTRAKVGARLEALLGRGAGEGLNAAA